MFCFLRSFIYLRDKAVVKEIPRSLKKDLIYVIIFMSWFFISANIFFHSGLCNAKVIRMNSTVRVCRWSIHQHMFRSFPFLFTRWIVPSQAFYLHRDQYHNLAVIIKILSILTWIIGELLWSLFYLVFKLNTRW
jgi:hypothetical protein